MEFTGKIQNISKDWQTGKFQITFEMEAGTIQEANNLQDCLLSVRAVKFRKKRSLDANGLLWMCLGQLATALKTDKWSVYLQMLKRYGTYTYICVKPNVVDAVKSQWRECEEMGEIEINGKKAVQMLCYFGSSTYNTKEFSVLLDGVISEMKEMGLEIPTSKEMERALELWNQLSNKKENASCAPQQET